MKKIRNCLLILFSIALLSGCSNESIDKDTGEPEIIQSNGIGENIISGNNDYGELISVYPYADVIEHYKKVNIDGLTANTNPASEYKGLGVITGNNSSRLLMDYKTDNPDEYWDMMKYLFEPDMGAGFSHIKIELYANGAADLNTNSDFMFASDAKSINSEITVDLMLSGEPLKVTEAFKENAETGYGVCYEWYKEKIEEAFNKYGFSVNYISADTGESETDWVIYLSNALKSENNSLYDYSKIKIIAYDETGGLHTSDKMLKNAALRNAVDILSINSAAAEQAVELNEKYNKELWYSENTTFTGKESSSKIGNGFDLSGKNNALDILSRIISSYYNGKTTMYENQQAVAAYYSGTKIFSGSLVTAQTPWSGDFELGAGVWASMHFTSFIKKGWQFVDSACLDDGVQNKYMTVTDPVTGDYSIIICNNSDDRLGYTFTITNLKKADALIHVWETRDTTDNEDDEYYTNYMHIADEFYPVEQETGDNGIIENEEPENAENSEKLPPQMFSVTVQPNSIVTITTLDKANEIIDLRDYNFNYDDDDFYFSKILEIPWNDNYEYDSEFLKERSNIPKYTIDQNGIFEIAVDYDEEHGNVLMQKSTYADKIVSESNPITSFGDDRWENYEAAIDFKLDENGDSENYTQFGVRYLLSEINPTAEHGYSIKIYQDGRFELKKSERIVKTGDIIGFDSNIWHNIKITVNGNQITVFLNGVQLTDFKDEGGVINSGRLSVSSEYFNNCFDNVSVSEIDEVNPYVVRIDNCSPLIEYNGLWEKKASENHLAFKHTLSRSLEAGAEFSFYFAGSELAVIGNSDECVLNIIIDGEENQVNISETDSRETIYKINGLGYNSHDVYIEVLSGSFSFDVLEYS